ncbi:MAG: hypothetical protein OQK00_09040 [Rhodobacteraceae bacterium]|nr:hypothetical protein [Paracoccaceae bacterium]
MADVTMEGFNPAPPEGQLTANIFTFLKSLGVFHVYKGIRAVSHPIIKIGQKIFSFYFRPLPQLQSETRHSQKHDFEMRNLLRITLPAVKSRCKSFTLHKANIRHAIEAGRI